MNERVPPDLGAILREHPEVGKLFVDVLNLTQAALVLRERKPPNYETAADYLDATAHAILTMAGIPDAGADGVLAKAREQKT